MANTQYNNVRLVLDASKRLISVYIGNVEIEHIYCNMEVAKYPCLKMKSTHLYALVNRESQGFRVTFSAEQKAQFMSIIRRVAYISETPEKNHMNRTFTRTDRWGRSADNNTTISSSQPITPSERRDPRTGFHSMKTAARNLAQNFIPELYEGSQLSSPAISPMSFFSQPVHNPYSRPISSASSISSSISSVLSSLNDDGPYYNFSQSSSSSSYKNSPLSDNLRSPFHGSQSSDQTRPACSNLITNAPLSFSQQSSDPFTQLSPPARTANKCIQTDENTIDNMIEDPIFMSRFLERMIKNARIRDLVRAMRAQIRKMPIETLENFHNSTRPVGYRGSSSNQHQPAVTNQTSDLEYDVFH
ncbi:hypothetical protein GCK72_014302 [Caenorhabditis remanei]|uniref:Uncharacterized protein n=1 Tax=Caenorhabditis remanei TaxID=31234 RepID=A0A6A5GTN7_CAERE|nr:hypothetical protein GCK72_014302 [Caenorhabditis remanei]KAF1757845.1 hypothetical protein GCK72_014302 [Caenorhabditis remanei]